jgi:uncharacterized phage protein gp47/JayE
MAGLTIDGLTINRLPEVIEDLKAQAVEIFQDVTPEGEVVNVEANSALGRMIGVVAPSGADLWEAIQEVYDAFNPNAAQGIALDNIVALGGTQRLPATATRADVLVTGDINVTIPAGSKVTSSTTGQMYSFPILRQITATDATGVGISLNPVANSTTYTVSYRKSLQVANTAITVVSPATGATRDTIFQQFANLITNSFPDFTSYVSAADRLFIQSVDPLQTFVFSSSASVSINKAVRPSIVVGDTFGPFAQAPNTIDLIATPILGWDSITSPIAAVTGNDTETDAELRVRFRNTKFEKATNVIESLYSSILSLEGIGDLRIYENDTNVVDGNGVNGHSFLAIVDGGLSSQIGQSIWDNKPVGILSQGNTTVTIFDSQGLPHDVAFSRPTAVQVAIALNITTFSNLPQDGEQKIKDALSAHFETLSIGDDVIYSRLYTPINSVQGFQINSLTVNAGAGNVMANIPIGFSSIAALNQNNITITLV